MRAATALQQRPAMAGQQRVAALRISSRARASPLPLPHARRPRAPLRPLALARPAGEEEASGLGDRAGGAGIGPFLSVPDRAIVARGGAGGGMEENMGSQSALGAVLERNRVNIIMPTPPHVAPKLDDGGDGGGLGKNNHNGGGGGDGGGDDDDYFGGGEGDGEGGDGSGGGGGGFVHSLFRVHIPELFDRAALAAVLQEWFKTVADLPLFIRRSVEMGLFSSAQLVRFLSMDVRPNITRAVSRALPTAWAREFVGRLMADPAFAQKLVIEQTLAFSASMYHEWRVRGDAFKKELDLAIINSMGLAAAVGAAVWVTAPSRAFGAAHRYPWQRMLAELPHCVFDASGPLRTYTAPARVAGFFASAAQLSAAGAVAGAATAAAGSLAVAARRRTDPAFEPSVPVAGVGRSSAGLGAFFALNANARYQLLGGLDRFLFGRAAALWGYIATTGAARVAGTAAGELTRPWWQGLATETAASHSQPRTRVRKVRRRVVRRPAQQQQQQHAAAAGGEAAGGEELRLAALAAAAAAGAGALAAPPLGLEEGEAVAAALERLEHHQQLHHEHESQAQQLHGGSLEAEVAQRLAAAPALMGSPEGLSRLAQQGSFSGSAMGEALRDAVGTGAAA